MTFVIAFVYLIYEKVDNFEWALSKVKGLCKKNALLLQLFVSYRDLAFI